MGLDPVASRVVAPMGLASMGLATMVVGAVDPPSAVGLALALAAMAWHWPQLALAPIGLTPARAAEFHPAVDAMTPHNPDDNPERGALAT